MTKLNSVNNSIYRKIYSKQSAYSEKNKYKNTEVEGQKASEEKDSITNKKLLSNNEINTLHMFFGSEKPEEMQFYGNNKVDTIHKGQFLDLKG